MALRFVWVSIADALLTAARQTPLLRGQGMSVPSTNASLIALRRSGGHESQIPAQLVLTARQASLDHMSKHVQDNIRRTLKLSPELRLRWFSDVDCLIYIHTHYDAELAQYYIQERKGMYRGDMCRAAVLAKEGGFYTDLDVQMKVSLTSLVAYDTTFMSAHAAEGSILNAIMASKPGSNIMLESIEVMRRKYRNHESVEFLGPNSLLEVFTQFAKGNCSNLGLPTASPAWRCGSEVVRMYQEMRFECWGKNARSDEICPSKRLTATFLYDGANYGLFDWNGKIVGWSRFDDCVENGCGAGGPKDSNHLLENRP